MTAQRAKRGQIKVGSCIIAERRQAAGTYDRRKHRLREIDAIVRDRHGEIISADVDVEPYMEAVAFSANALGASVEQAISGWCARFAPHLSARINEIAPLIRLRVEGRKYDLNADDAAVLLRVTFGERQRLGLKTIGACDLSPTAFKEACKQAKRRRDRERLAEKRKAKRPRSESLMQTKPWDADGVSRATWYRHQKDGGTIMSPCSPGDETVLSPRAQSRETEMSLTRNLSGRATLLSHVSIEPSLHDLHTPGGAPRAAVTEDIDDAI